MEIEAISPDNVCQPPALTKLLKSPDTGLPDILNHPLIFRLFRQEDRQVIEFFVNHASDLIELVFSNDQPELSARAFALFEHCDPTLTEAILQNNLFHNAVCTILGKNDTTPLMLSRISTLTYAIYLVDSNYLIQSCGFILQLLSVVSETTVMSLFESLCKPDPENINVQNWLINDIGFIETIHTEVDEYRCAVDTGIYDNQANLLVALLKLIKICAENPLFSKHVCNHAFVYSLNRNIGDYPQFIEDARWEALSAIFHPRTQEMLHGLFQSAVEIIKDPIKCRTRSSCACLSILTKMMQYDELMRPYIIKLQLAKTVFAIMIENCGHSILHNECRTFISGFFSYNNCAESDEEQAKFLIHQVMVNTQSKDCHLRASMKLLANKIIVAIAKKPKLVKAAREIPSFTPKFTTFLQKYDENINTYYGGACETNSDEAQSYGMMALKLFRCF